MGWDGSDLWKSLAVHLRQIIGAWLHLHLCSIRCVMASKIFIPCRAQITHPLSAKVAAFPWQDQLAMSAIQFLTTVSKSSVNSSLFKNEDALRQICEKIVIPNLRLNDDLEEMFEMNYVEYVRRDTEGNDFDTRRRAATELVKALNTQFEAEVGCILKISVLPMWRLPEHAAIVKQ